VARGGVVAAWWELDISSLSRPMGIGIRRSGMWLSALGWVLGCFGRTRSSVQPYRAKGRAA